MKDNLLFGDFVSPLICDKLAGLGLTSKTCYFWRFNAGLKDCELITQHFDKDGYYSYGQNLICYANHSRVVPAYSIKNIERCLPPYLLTRHESGEYEMSLMASWCDKTFTGTRLPDLLASVLQALLESRIVELHLLNQIIESEA